MQFRIIHVGVFLALLGVVSCQTTQNIGGTNSSLANAYISGDFGAGLDEATRAKAVNAELKALEHGLSGAPIIWAGQSNISGQVIPQQPFQIGEAICRRYTHSITKSGSISKKTATACKDKDNNWQLLE